MHFLPVILSIAFTTKSGGSENEKDEGISKNQKTKYNIFLSAAEI
jgi:hypothetical protein